jgi:hypothetical protein
MVQLRGNGPFIGRFVVPKIKEATSNTEGRSDHHGGFLVAVCCFGVVLFVLCAEPPLLGEIGGLTF